MGSIQDIIMEHAMTMGTFSTTEMSLAIYGDACHVKICSIYKALNRLAKWGLIARLGMVRIRGHNVMMWKVVA